MNMIITFTQKHFTKNIFHGGQTGIKRTKTRLSRGFAKMAISGGLVAAMTMSLPAYANPVIEEETPSRAGLHDPGFTLSMALLHFNNKEYDKAKQFFLKYIEMAGPEEVAYRHLAEISIYEKNYDEAEDFLKSALQADPKSEASLELLAGIHLQRGQYNKAIPVYEKIVELDPLDERALYALAEIYKMNNQGRKSIVYYRKLAVAVEKQSNNSYYLQVAYTHLAGYYYNNQDYAKAMEYHEKIMELDPNDVNSHYTLAELYKINGRFEDSARVMISILPRVNKEGRLVILESLVETLYILDDYRLKKYLSEFFGIKSNKNELMRGILFEVENNPKAAEKYFQKALQKNSGRLSAHIGLYRLYTRAGNTEKAQTEAYRIIIAAQNSGALKLSREYLTKLYTSFDGQNRESDFHNTYFHPKGTYSDEEVHRNIDTAVKYVEMYNTHATTLEAQKRRVQAISYYHESLRYLNQSDLWLEKIAPPQEPKIEEEPAKTEDTKEGEEVLTEAEKKQLEYKEKKEKYDALKTFLNDRKYRTLIALTWLMHQAETPDKPQIDSQLAKAIQLAPEEPQARFLAGVINFSFGEDEPERYPVAEKHLTDAVAMYEKLSTNKKANPNYYYYLGVVQEKQGKFEQTIVQLEQAIELDPFNPIYLNYLGYMYSLHDMELEKAYEYVKRALDDAPEEAMYLDTLGWIYFKMGKYEEALGQLLVAHTYAEKEDIHDPVISFHLAETYFKLENRHLALMYYKQTLADIEFASEPLDKEYLKKQILSLGGTEEQIQKIEERAKKKK